MEEGSPQNPYSPSSQPPYDSPYQFNNSTQNHVQIRYVPNHGAADQAIESAFSRLSISQTTPLPRSVLPETVDGMMPVESGEKAQDLLCAQAHSNNGGVNGPLGSVWAHQSRNVGPDARDFFGGNSCINAGDHQLKMMKSYERHDFGGATCTDHGLCSLHGKEPFGIEANNHVPIVSSSLQSNFCSLGCNNSNNFRSSMSSFHSNQHLYNQEQHDLALVNMRRGIVSLAKDRHWSGVLKLKLEEGLCVEEIEVILQEVMGFLSDLMKDQFGYQFVQKLFVVCNEVQRTRIVLAITKFPFKLIGICLNSYGSKAMQKLLEMLSTPQQIAVVMSALSLDAIALANDLNGHHVIQYCVKSFPVEYNKHLFNEIAKNCFKIATNQSGCCVVQSCVEYSRGAAKERLANMIIQNAVHLAENPYGNYVVQQLIGMGSQEVTTQLLRQCQGYFVSFSCNKYASNVVEKFFEESGEKHCAIIIMELLSSPYAPMLLVDPFGNFVIQKALPRATGHLLDALVNLIRINAPLMQHNLYGRKVLARFEKWKHQNA